MKLIINQYRIGREPFRLFLSVVGAKFEEEHQNIDANDNKNHTFKHFYPRLVDTNDNTTFQTPEAIST